MNINLPESDVTAELTFQSRDQANEFARMYSRKTLRGHTITGSTVKVWNVTDDDKAWIDSYVNQLNNLLLTTNHIRGRT